ncbi:MAG: helix-turn-helix transcriptional regulator [Spirochaetia bacterium]|nr:helix-turn-helix transcriptional regulator [Spirochaetia bacterium]
MDFRGRLREEIENSGLFDKEVADRAGITKRAIDSYVGARGCMPSADVAVRLARVLGCSVEYLVTGRDTRQRHLDNKSRRIVQLFQRLSPEDQDTVLHLIERMVE